MEYLNQTIVFMSEENKELKEKVRRLELICKNITQMNSITTDNISKTDNTSKTELMRMNSQNDFEQWQLNSPTSTKAQPFFNQKTHQENPMAKLQSQLTQLKHQLCLTTSQLHETQLESLNKSTKIKQLHTQLTKAKEEITYLKKQMGQEKQNLKMFYETTVVQEMRERFEEEKQREEKRFLGERESLEREVTGLREKVGHQQNSMSQINKELVQKNSKQQRLLSIIAELKHLLQSSSDEHQQQIDQLNSALHCTDQQLQSLKHNYTLLSQHYHQQQNLNDQLHFQVKKLRKQITNTKKQHQRSISKTERELLRQKSMSKNIQKHYNMQKKFLQAELKKKHSTQKYHLQKQKLLINKIKNIENQSILLLNQNNKSNSDIHNCTNLSSLSSVQLNKVGAHGKSPINKLNVQNRASYIKSQSPINRSNLDTSQSYLLNEQSSKPSFTKFLQATPNNAKDNPPANSNKSKQRIVSSSYTPKSVVKLKANTISVINKDKIHSTNVTARPSNQTPSTSRQHSNQSKSQINSISLKDTKYHNQTVTEFSLSPHHDPTQTKTQIKQSLPQFNSNHTSPSYHSQESLEIHNCSSIDVLKDNLSYFPSNKTSKNNSPIKVNTFSKDKSLLIEEFVEEEKENAKSSINQHIEELRKLQHYMRTSFNPNHQTQFMANHSDCQRGNTQIETKLSTISQFRLVPEEFQHQSPLSILDSVKRRELIQQEQLINKILKTEESNQKSSQQMFIPQKTAKHKPEQIQELLTSTQRHLRNHKQQTQQTPTNEPFSFVSLISSNQKPSQTSFNKKPVPQIQVSEQNNESLYKPHKDIMKLTDLDTPCFQSSPMNQPKTNRDNIVNQPINCAQMTPNSTRQNLQKRKRISISITNMNQTPQTIKK